MLGRLAEGATHLHGQYESYGVRKSREDVPPPARASSLRKGRSHWCETPLAKTFCRSDIRASAPAERPRSLIPLSRLDSCPRASALPLLACRTSLKSQPKTEPPPASFLLDPRRRRHWEAHPAVRRPFARTTHFSGSFRGHCERCRTPAMTHRAFRSRAVAGLVSAVPGFPRPVRHEWHGGSLPSTGSSPRTRSGGSALR